MVVYVRSNRLTMRFIDSTDCSDANPTVCHRRAKIGMCLVRRWNLGVSESLGNAHANQLPNDEQEFQRAEFVATKWTSNRIQLIALVEFVKESGEALCRTVITATYGTT